MTRETLILASASPRRRELLKQYGYRFIADPADVKEIISTHHTVGEIALFNAKQKATAISKKRPGSVVLGSDTLVALEGQIFGKPRNLEEAYKMLRQLNGRLHQVFTGVWITRLSIRQNFGFVEMSHVRFRKLTDAEIRTYITLINPLDKAGGYAAQDDKMGIIESIKGSRTNVIGLPMESLEQVFKGVKRQPG